MDCSEYSNADINWYVRMPTNPPTVNQKVETPLGLFQEEDANPEQICPVMDNQLSYWDV